MAYYVAPPPAGMQALDVSNLNETVKRADIDMKHAEWEANRDLWTRVHLMYEGGGAIKAAASMFLEQRPKEDPTVYAHRLNQFNYENNIGTGLGWHEASMFEAEPSIDIRLKKADGTPQATDDAQKPALSDDQDAFYGGFIKNCDRKGTTYIDLWRKGFTNLLLYRKTYICIDLPADNPDAPAQTLQQQKDDKLLDPYTCMVTPLDVINWGLDGDGNLDWCVLYSKTEQRGFLQSPSLLERWYYYDKQTFRVYKCVTDLSKASSNGTATSVGVNLAASALVPDQADKVPVQLERVGYHCLASQNRVPVIPVSVPEGWWMANRVYLPAMEHINVSNALKWSLFMAALAMPVLCTDANVDSLTMTEAGHIKLNQGDTFGFAEPQGRAWEWLAKRADTLKEEIWRGMYLVSQARNTSATAMAASGVSKQQDMQPSHDVLNGLGDVLRAGMQLVLGYVAQARAALPGNDGDLNLTFDVRGFVFEDKLSTDDILIIQDLLNMQVPSDKFDKELYIMAVRSALKDVNPDRLEEIVQEIMAAPSRAEQAQQDAAAQAQQLQTQFQKLNKDDPEGG